MPTEAFTTPRATRGSLRTSVVSLDAATYTRLAWLRRACVEDIGVPINNSLLIRIAVDLLARHLDAVLTEEDDYARQGFAMRVKAHARGHYIRANEARVLKAPKRPSLREVEVGA